MKLFPPPLVVDNTEGFTVKIDLFGRKLIAEGMTNLLTKVSPPPLTVAVDGQWGSGKTAFLKMWPVRRAEPNTERAMQIPQRGGGQTPSPQDRSTSRV